MQAEFWEEELKYSHRVNPLGKGGNIGLRETWDPIYAQLQMSLILVINKE